MNKQKAIVRTNYGKALYIYYQGVIQCLICGWWHKTNTIEDAKELWQTHAIRKRSKENGKPRPAH